MARVEARTATLDERQVALLRDPTLAILATLRCDWTPRKYTGKDFSLWPGQQRVIVKITPERVN
jgi:hypothetical protein